MPKSIPYNNQGSAPGPAKPKGRLKYKPMPQTVREQVGKLFRVEWRTESMIAHPKRGKDEGWSTCRLPRNITLIRPMYATQLTKELADRVVQYWRTRPGGDTFEYRLVQE